MTDCSCTDADLGGGSGVRYEQIDFSFGEDVKPTLKFDASAVTADAGLAPLRELDERLGLTELAAALIDDLRRPKMTVHPVRRLVRETVYAYAAGYEDANDHTPLSADVWFRELVGATNAGSVNPQRHDGLASDPTISRLLGGRKLDLDGLGSVHVEWFARLVENAPPAVVTLDIDGYDAETYGMQQLSLFNGYYREKMYYPLLVTVAEYGFIVAARLRPGSAWSGAEAVPLLRPVLQRLREVLPNTRVRLRADSGFRDPALYDLLDEFGVEYAIRLRLSQPLGRLFDERLASKLEKMLSRAPDARCAVYHETAFAAKSWPGKRRICLKMQNEPAKDRVARYVIVTSSRESKRKVWEFYEHRGQCEQRIDEMRNHLRADKFSCAEFSPNEVKLHMIAMAHNLFAAARAMLPAEHELKRATVARLRTTLVKCGATLVRTVRRLWLHASRTWPYRDLLADVSRRFARGRLAAVPLWDAG